MTRSTIKPTIEDSLFHRTADFRSQTVKVTVYQSVDIKTGKWEACRVGWASIGSVGAGVAAEFANSILDACALADQWTLEREGLEREGLDREEATATK